VRGHRQGGSAWLRTWLDAGIEGGARSGLTLVCRRGADCGAARRGRRRGGERALRESAELYAFVQEVTQAQRGFADQQNALALRTLADVHTQLAQHGAPAALPVRTALPDRVPAARALCELGRVRPARRACLPVAGLGAGGCASWGRAELGALRRRAVTRDRPARAETARRAAPGPGRACPRPRGCRGAWPRRADAASARARADEAVRCAEQALQAMQGVAGRTHPVMQSFWDALAGIKEAVRPVP
jgi:hypothetical protein